jgi:hypothetical protein
MARSDKFRVWNQVAVAFVNPYRSNVEQNSTAVAAVPGHPQICVLLYSVFWWLSLSFCLFVPDFELDDKRFCGKLIWTKLLEYTGII